MQVNTEGNKVKVADAGMGRFPECDLCFGTIRKPCTLEYNSLKNDKKIQLLVCGGCFKIAMIIGRMQTYGYIQASETR